MVVLVRILLDFRAALRAAQKRGWPLVYRVGLALQRLVEHLLGQDMANGLDGFLDGTEFGPPSRAFVAIKTIDEILGDAFEVGTDRVGWSGGNQELRHPWHLSENEGSRISGEGMYHECQRWSKPNRKLFSLPSPMSTWAALDASLAVPRVVRHRLLEGRVRPCKPCRTPHLRGRHR